MLGIRRRLDHTPDRAGYIRTQAWMLLTGVVLVAVGVELAGLWALRHDECPGVCEERANEIDALGLWGFGVFVVTWIGLWCVPWWRGLRRWRITAAAVATTPLLLAMWEMLTT